MSGRPSASRSAICTFEIRGRSLPRSGSPTGRAAKKSDGGPFGRMARRPSPALSKVPRPGVCPHAQATTPRRHAATPRRTTFEHTLDVGAVGVDERGLMTRAGGPEHEVKVLVW